MYKEALKTVINNYPCPFGDSPLKMDGLPTLALVKWLIMWSARMKKEKDKMETELDLKTKLLDIYVARDKKRTNKIKEIIK